MENVHCKRQSVLGDGILRSNASGKRANASRKFVLVQVPNAIQVPLQRWC
jgi:hypothetical protein